MVWAGECDEGFNLTDDDDNEDFNLEDDDIDEGFGIEEDDVAGGFGVKDDGKDNTRQLALRLASLGCLVVCCDRDGDTNKTTVNDIQVRWKVQPTSGIKSYICPLGGWRYSLGVSM